MAEQNRVQQWRQAKREQGLKAVTVWLTTDQELRLKDLAVTWHCSPSEVMQHALAQFHPGRPPRIGHDTDTTQIRHGDAPDMSQIQAWIEAELPGMVRGIVEQLAVEMLAETVSDVFDDTEDEERDSDVTDDELIPDSDVSDETQIHTSAALETPQRRHSNASETTTPATYDTTRYYLGKLCPKKHDYEGSGQSLLYRRNRRCVACDREAARARRRGEG